MLVILALIWFFYSLAVHIAAGSPDGSTVLLEGDSIRHGSLALQGWALSLDSFWAIDATYYAVAVALTGLHLGLLHFVPAVIAALVVVAAILVGREGLRGRGALVASVTVVALLALPSPDLAYHLLQGPWHVGSALYCLVAVGCLRRGRFDRGWLLAVLLLAAGLVSDLLVLVFAVVPIGLAGTLAMVRRRQVREGLATVAASLSSLVLAVAIVTVAHVFGSFTLVNRNLPVRFSRIEANLGHLVNRFDGLFGVGTIPLKGVENGVFLAQLLHLVGLLVVLGALGWAILRLLRGLWRPASTPMGEERWRVDDILLIAVLADAAFFVVGSPSGNFQYVKYLTPGVIFAAVLAARLLGELSERPWPRRALRFATAGGACVAVGFALESLFGLSVPAPAQKNTPLDSFLLAHHLSAGVGDYWSSSLVTVGTGGRVDVRPVSTNPDGTLRRYERQSSADWYRGKRFTFLVYDSSRPWHDVNETAARATFGPPAHAYAVGSYRVLVWARPFAVSLVVPPYGSPLQFFWTSPATPSQSQVPQNS